MGTGEDGPKHNKREGTVLNDALASKLSGVTLAINDKTPLGDLLVLNIRNRQKQNPEVKAWFDALAGLHDSEQVGQIRRSLFALVRAGVQTAGDVRDIPDLDRNIVVGVHDLGEKRLHFIKQLFPTPPPAK